MKNLCAAILMLFLSTPAIPIPTHRDSRASFENDQQSELADMKGTVRADNAKITFLADVGGKSWNVLNPEILRNYVDQHVQVKAQQYADKDEIHVESVIPL